MKYKNLTAKEYEIMNILWESDRPLQISEVLSMTKTISANSIHHMMKALLDNGYVKIVGNVKLVKAPSRLYVANISIEEYAAMKSSEIFKNSNKKFNLKSFLLCLAKKTDDKDIAEEFNKIMDAFQNDK